jgi:predicted nucleotidyltransferase
MQLRSVEAIVTVLNEAQVQYLIVGGLAVNAHGYERLTRDVDVVIGLQPENIMRGVRALRSIGYETVVPVTAEQFADRATREMWRREKNMIVLQFWSEKHERTPVDVFVYEPFDFALEYSRARWEYVTDKARAAVVGYEALIAMKQAAGRERDLSDIQALRKLDPHR